MKFYLSSYRLGDQPDELAKLVSGNKKTAVISSARDAFDRDDVVERMTREMDELTNLGFEPEEVRFSDYFDKPAELDSKLSEHGLLWILGGNVFVLRRAMLDSRFDQWIERARDQEIVYAGYSAAGCVAGPTLKGLDIVDDPEEVKAAYGKDVEWSGLELVPFSFAPHYRSDHPESAGVEKEVEYLKSHNMPYRAIKDGQAIIIENGEERTVG